MILEQHYDDAVLIAFLGDEPAARRDPHLISCHPCAETLAALRTMAEALEDETVWELRELDDTPRQSTIDTLRAKQRELAGEDAAAAPRLKQLLAQPREMWAGMIEAHPEWRTAGMVRAMVGEADRRTFVSPPDALELSRIAADSASPLDPVGRAEALREYGYSLFYTGALNDALKTTNEAERLLTDGKNQHLAARLAVQRALILSEMGEHIQARVIAAEAAEVFRVEKDDSRFVAARRVEAFAAFRVQRHRDALAIFTDLSVSSSDPSLILNIAACHRELGDFGTATQFFLQAVDSFERLGQTANLAKAKWHLARTFIAEGRHDEALVVLRNARELLRALKMSEDVALVTIDIAYVLTATESYNDVAELCREATRYFASENLAESEGAMTALALIREATSQGRLTLQVVENARRTAKPRPRLRYLFLE